MSDKALAYFKSRYAQHDWELVAGRSSGSIRNVYRLNKNGHPEFFIKIYNPQNFWDKLSNRLHARTLHEARMYKALEQAGIQTPEVHAHMRYRCATALITQAISPGGDLYTVEIELQARIMLDTAVRLLQKNFTHTDLHPGNVLLDDDGRPVLIDVYELKTHSNITTRHIVELLAGVDSLYDYATSELSAALSRISAAAQKRGLEKKIKRRAATLRARRIGRWVKRTLRAGSFSHQIKNADYTALINKRFSLDIQSIFTQPIPKHIEAIATHGPLSCHVEYFAAPGHFGKIPAKRLWCDLAAKHFNDIPAPVPVGLIIFKDRSSILITAPAKSI